ncbi:hypothetical protein TrLO_g3227 [Triparma laevis f. longispina]|uniref:Uncharacterized protein n=1 Tax=Triparma laevis f. longispina TaxID=1714387 RepID=A0A9W7A119_9STRA|nr:hypothetical protein TrLO_g3227 [Triparma laevis f. longispina]
MATAVRTNLARSVNMSDNLTFTLTRARKMKKFTPKQYSWDWGTDSHKTIREERNFGGLTIQELSALREQKKLLKNDKNNVETELAAECLVKEDALRGKESALEEERKNLSVIISQLKEENDALRKILRRSSGPVTLSVARSLDRGTPGVKKVGVDVLSKNATIKYCRTDVTIHEEPEVLLEAILGDQTKVGMTLYQKVVEEGVAYWSLMFTNTKSCDLLLRMRVEGHDEDGVVVRVESIEEKELESTSLPNPHSTTTKKARLLLNEGIIVLRPLPLGQTFFTFTARIDVGEVTKDAVIASTTEDENSSKGGPH